MAARSRKPKGEVAAATKAAKEDSQRSVMDIPSLQQFLELIGSFSPDLIHHRGSVKSIYHYTDFNGLKGIVEKNDLWLTNSRYSNDDEEMIHGLDVVRQPATELSPEDWQKLIELKPDGGLQLLETGTPAHEVPRRRRDRESGFGHGFLGWNLPQRLVPGVEGRRSEPDPRARWSGRRTTFA